MVTLKQMEEFFNTVKLPETFEFAPHMKSTNTRATVDSHIATLKSNTGNKRFMPYYNRLKQIYQTLKNDRA